MRSLSLGTKVAIPTGAVGVITDFSLAVTVDVEGPQGRREFTVDFPTARLWADRYEEQYGDREEPSTEPNRPDVTTKGNDADDVENQHKTRSTPDGTERGDDGDWIYAAGAWYDLSESRTMARMGPAPTEDDDVTAVGEDATVDVDDWR